MKKMLSLILALCLVLACASTAFAAVPKFMSVGTGSTGGAYYPIGVAIAEVLTSKLGTQATAEVTGGSLDNLMLINQGDCDLGIAQGNNMMDAYYGTGDYVDNAYENINAMFGGLSKGFFQVVVLDNSPIQSMADLKGKKVCMGPAGNAAIILADLVWGKYGFSTPSWKTAMWTQSISRRLFLHLQFSSWLQAAKLIVSSPWMKTLPTNSAKNMATSATAPFPPLCTTT